MKNNEITKEYLEKNYKRLHTASRRGYESRKGNGYAEGYKGRYGNGYVWVSPRWDTTSYVNITYYVKEN